VVFSLFTSLLNCQSFREATLSFERQLPVIWRGDAKFWASDSDEKHKQP
jgi:hypothetical protein